MKAKQLSKRDAVKLIERALGRLERAEDAPSVLDAARGLVQLDIPTHVSGDTPDATARRV